jgi:OOP family OmpA-OmpF porin
MLRRLGTLAVLAIAALTLTAAPASARPYTEPGSFEVGVKLGGYFFLAGDDDVLKDTFAYGIHGSYNFTRLFAAELAFEASPREVNDVSIYLLHLDLIVHPLTHNWIQPFVGVGGTFATLDPKIGASDSDPGINAIAGLKFYPWEHVGIRADVRYIARIGTGKNEDTAHDLLAMFGLFGNFGGKRAPVAPVILDTDGDGILDPDDACPTVPGVPSAKGCPDRDGDTIPDDVDKCPDTPGPVELNGCPDTDGDGLIDLEDRCPAEAGPVELKGCPDTDGDGIPNIDDKCPEIPGVPEYEGCPPPPDEIVKEFSGVIEGIYFAVDSAVIRPQSAPKLDHAVEVLKQFPQINLMIEGHTSEEGGRAHNLPLSQSRADSVKQYLVDHGIDAGRLQTQGFGPDRPVAPNDKESNRRLNRRIEFKIITK